MESMARALGDALGELAEDATDVGGAFGGLASEAVHVVREELGVVGGAADDDNTAQGQHDRSAVYASVMGGLTKWECETEKGWIAYADHLANEFEACQVGRAGR